MALFDFFNSTKKPTRSTQVTDIGEFSFVQIDDIPHYKAEVNSKINSKIELLFPVKANKISTYQVEYFIGIENNWDAILEQLKIKKPAIAQSNRRFFL